SNALTKRTTWRSDTSCAYPPSRSEKRWCEAGATVLLWTRSGATTGQRVARRSRRAPRGNGHRLRGYRVPPPMSDDVPMTTKERDERRETADRCGARGWGDDRRARGRPAHVQGPW